MFNIHETDEEAVIDIFDSISFWGVDAIQVRDQINDIGDKKIHVRINSPGGDVFDGIAILNMLLEHKGGVDVSVIGIAASIASVIAMAGDNIRIRENARMMIHDPYTFALGNADELRETAEVLDMIKEDIITSYQIRSDLDRKEISNMMAKETFFSAEEAVKNGFATEVVSSKKDSASEESEVENKAREAAIAAAKARQRELDLVC